jgi:hypothetical protein
VEPDYDSLDPEERTNKYLALFSVAFGVFSFCAGIALPIAGVIIAIIGTVMGIFGMRSLDRKIAIVGLVISTLGLLTAAIFMILKSLNLQI